MRFQCAFCTTIIRSEADDSRLNCPNCGKQVAVPKSRFETGCVIDDFVIENVIGYGGMATVYLAKQLSLDRPVALKVLNDEYCKRDKFRDSFLKEAKAAARLNHPNIIQATRVDQEDGMLFYAMEYINGQTLANKIDVEKTLTIDIALNIIQQCAEALHTAWTQEGLIHRDIKPDNIMLAEDGYAKIMDLGIAITIDEAESAEVSGTPTYMAPEQFRRERLDCRTDIYSLGVTLYHSLVGFPPFDGENVKEIARKHVFNQLQFPANDLIYLPQRIKRLISKMMAKEPNDRYQDYEELLGDIVALRKRLAPDKDQVPNVHTISFSKYRLHEKMSDSPSEIYRRRSDKKKKVAIAKEQSSRSEKQETPKGPWIAIAILIVVILALGVSIVFVIRDSSEFSKQVDQYLTEVATESPGQSADLQKRVQQLEEQIDAIDNVAQLCPEDPGTRDLRALMKLMTYRNRLQADLVEERNNLFKFNEDELERQVEKVKEDATKKHQDAMAEVAKKMRETEERLNDLGNDLTTKDATLREVQKKFDELKKEYSEAQDRIQELKARNVRGLQYEAEMNIIDKCQRFHFSKARAIIDQLVKSNDSLKEWGRHWFNSIANAELIYRSVYNSGTSLRSVSVSLGVVQEIIHNEVKILVTHGNEVKRQEYNLSYLTPKDLITLAEQNWRGTEESFEAAKYDFAICMGDFALAKSFIEDNEEKQKELKEFIVRYLEQRVKQISDYAQTGNRNQASMRYRSLKSNYEDLDEFKAIADKLDELTKQ